MDVKKRRISQKDWKHVESIIQTELESRKKNPFRRNHEVLWKEVDRQVRMEEMKRIKHGGGDWHNVIELGELAKASEVLSADIRRILFPNNRAWFESHVEIEEPDRKLQKAMDGALRALMVQQHRDFGLKARVDLSIKEALHHGSFVAEVVFENEAKIHEGTKVENLGAPVWVPHSMWNCYPDPSASIIGTNKFYNGSMMIVSYKPRHKLMASAKGEGWMPSQLSRVKKQRNKNKDVETEDVELVTYYGDLEIPRQDGNILLLNSKVILANGTIVYYKPNDLPFAPVIYSGYERIDVRDPYYISPIIKLSPMQKLASTLTNKFLDLIDLKVEPPIIYDASDPDFVESGGPVIEPGHKSATRGSASHSIIETGDPNSALSALQLILQQMQGGSGVDNGRAGSSDNVEKTATEVRRVEQSGEIRTIDFVDKFETQGLTTFLYFQHELNMKSMGAYSFYNPEFDADDFMRLTKTELPKSVHFEVVGSKGLLGEQDRAERSSLVTAFWMDRNPNLLKQAELAKEMYQDAGVKNAERFLNLPDDEQAAIREQYEQAIQELQTQIQELEDDREIKMEEIASKERMNSEDNQTKLQIAFDDLRAKLDEKRIENGQAPIPPEVDDAVRALGEMVNQLINKESQPKVIERDEAGFAVSVNGKPIIRDNLGRVAAIGS